jgi:hypothetical protein
MINKLARRHEDVCIEWRLSGVLSIGITIVIPTQHIPLRNMDLPSIFLLSRLQLGRAVQLTDSFLLQTALGNKQVYLIGQHN